MFWTPQYLLLVVLAVSDLKKKKVVAIGIPPSSRASYSLLSFVFNHLWAEKTVQLVRIMYKFRAHFQSGSVRISHIRRAWISTSILVVQKS